MAASDMHPSGNHRLTVPWPCLAVLVGFALSHVAGCKTGASAMSAPSWWSFGGKPADAEKLSAAPPFAGDGAIRKPSESATPYPTTSTPAGYSVADAAAGAPAQSAPAVTEPTTITYGSRPPAPTAPPANVVAAPPAAPAAPVAGSPGAIAPQVGPYTSLAATTPSAAAAASSAPPSVASPTVPFGSNPAAPSSASPSTFPATAGYEPAPVARPADPYGVAAAPPPSSSFGESAVPPTRYASASASRFGGTLAGASPTASDPPAALAPATAGIGLSAPAAAAPQSSLPAAPPPLPSAPPLPGAPPLPTPPANAPPRRPDPGYRPAGTSSYRPTRAILVESEAGSTSAVRPASFEQPIATPPQ